MAYRCNAGDEGGEARVVCELKGGVVNWGLSMLCTHNDDSGFDKASCKMAGRKNVLSADISECGFYLKI